MSPSCSDSIEENNLVGTIPTEIGLLSNLAIWGMERGGLTGPIPSEIGNLSNLIFLDLDFNDLTGTLPTELYLLVGLTQLDVNNNRLSGNIDQIGIFQQLDFLQIHANLFTYVSSVLVSNLATDDTDHSYNDLLVPFVAVEQFQHPWGA